MDIISLWGRNSYDRLLEVATGNNQPGSVNSAGRDIWIPKLSLKESHDISALTAFIKNYTPEAKLVEYVGSEAQFALPFSSASIFPDLFRAIDANEVGFQIVADHTRVSFDRSEWL